MNKAGEKGNNALKDVQPIRKIEDIQNMKWALNYYCGRRDYILFLIGINTGLRVGDLVKLKVKDVKKKKQAIIKEGKTKKPRKVLLENIYEELNDYIETLDSEFLFPSRKGSSHISTTQAYRQLQKAAEMAEVEHIGTHSMRKTFGYWYYKQYKDIAQLQNILNHSHPSITLNYIGITDEQVEDSLKGFKL